VVGKQETEKLGRVISGLLVIRECLQSVPFAIVILEHQRIIDVDPGAPFNCCTEHKFKSVFRFFLLAVNCYMYYDNMSRINNQFSVGVHIMTALGDHHGEQVTSAHLTASVRAHDSQVRSVLSKLVKAGLVVTSRGRNGFSSLSRPANKISLLEIYKAAGAPPVFSIHGYPKEKTCRTSCTHKQAMVELLEDTQRAFETRLGQRMLSEMVAKARRYK
jgi:DNA-binding IscR family transcriptional regulator